MRRDAYRCLDQIPLSVEGQIPLKPKQVQNSCRECFLVSWPEMHRASQSQGAFWGNGLKQSAIAHGRDESAHNKALVRTQTTLRFVCAAQLGR